MLSNQLAIHGLIDFMMIFETKFNCAGLYSVIYIYILKKTIAVLCKWDSHLKKIK